jgi:hypothetical protein
MNHHDSELRPDASVRGVNAEKLIAGIFNDGGWGVRSGHPEHSAPRPDLIVHRGNISYAVEVKAAAEGRRDRLIPLWSQAWLQAAHAADGHRPLAVVVAPKIASNVAASVLDFAAEFAPDAAVGVVDFAGLKVFRGPLLEKLNSELPLLQRSRRHAPSAQHNMFSDANQWMLKILLAPEIPERMLAAPRGRYRNASQLAAAAGVSVMSACRLVQQLQREGFLHESAPHLELVRRGELFSRWQAAASVRPVNEIPIRMLLRGDRHKELLNILHAAPSCLASFAAADALGVGFVKGVPPHVYVRHMSQAIGALKNVVPVARGEAPDIIFREPPAPRSIFRGAVHAGGSQVSDILQIWLDVSPDPSRGREQAEVIRKLVIDRLIEGDRVDAR